MFVKFNKSYPLCGSTYAADGLKPILLILGGAVIDSKNMSNFMTRGILAGVRDMCLP